MKLRYDIACGLDSPERTLHHREIILHKKFLKKLYEQWYDEFLKEIKTLPNDVYVEIGSGGGFLKEVAPGVICTDVLELPTNDKTFSALDMPFENNSVGGIFMVDTFHHISDAEKFLAEVSRVLVKNGKVIMIEPANSLWGRFIYKNFHHEPFDEKGGWTIPGTGPLSGANQALPWIVFERDQAIFRKRFPNLIIEKISYRNPLLYLLSGGVSYKQLLPDFMFPVINFLDRVLPGISKQVSMFEMIRIISI
ncbi:MAG: class I SAM-dependent methyltransferase [Bacteroidota bacterium]|jgi:SAM-dependent methyltransferase